MAPEMRIGFAFLAAFLWIARAGVDISPAFTLAADSVLGSPPNR